MAETDVVNVRLDDRSYRVHVARGLLERTGTLIAQASHARRIALVTDANVGALYADPTLASLRAEGFEVTLITVAAGEKSKSLAHVESICDQMIAAGLDRSSLVVALGGGVVGDLAGFVASIYFRGIPYVQIPTTIVAQVDSSVGGKTGVNAAAGKNLLGSFHQPILVIADVDSLRSLPPREFNEGFAEVIKHAIIRDAVLFDSLAQIDREHLAPLVRRNVEIKAEIVAADERELSGERALLNFGHTIGHAIENAAGYGTFLHGEAISLGLVAASEISVRRAGLTEAERAKIVSLLHRFELPTKLPADFPSEKILTALKLDKKFEDGAIRFVVTPRIGSARVSSEVTLRDIESAVAGLHAS